MFVYMYVHTCLRYVLYEMYMVVSVRQSILYTTVTECTLKYVRGNLASHAVVSLVVWQDYGVDM